MLLRIGAAALLLAPAGCGGKQAATTTSDLPPGCTVAEADAIVTAFLAHPTLAPAPFFVRSTARESDGRRFTSRSRSATLAHLRARLAAGERDRLISLRIAAADVNHASIAFRLTRYAPDFRGRGIVTRLASGAGTIDCAHGRIATWSMQGP